MKINKNFKIVLFTFSLVFLSIFLVFSLRIAQANTLWDATNDNIKTGIADPFGGAGGEDDVFAMIMRFINLFLSFIGLIFFIMILFSGYEWMTASGNSDQVDKAKHRMKSAFIGLIIILCAWVITKSVSGIVNDEILVFLPCNIFSKNV